MVYFIKKKQKGSILAFAVIIMSFLMIIAIGLAASSLLTRKGADISSNSTSSFQNTDKGMELFLYELYINTKPYDYLSDLADSIVDGSGNNYECKDDGNIAVISGKNGEGEFDVIAYKEANPNDNDNNIDFVVVDKCNTEIARIYKLKVTGHFATASRSIEVNLNNSLQRGLKGRWTFEGNAESIRLYGDDYPGAPMAKDRSKNEYILTLCPIEEDPDLTDTAHTGLCPLLSIEDSKIETGFFMSHMPKYDTTKENDPDEDRNCLSGDKIIACGSYVPGIFDIGSVGGGINNSGKRRPVEYNLEPDSEEYYSQSNVGRIGTEALEFNGYSHYLAPNLDKNAKSDDAKPGISPNANYVSEGYRKNLSLDESEGMSISLWFNNNSETGGGEDGTEKQVLISKTKIGDEKHGYELYLEEGKIIFRVNGQSVSLDLDGEDNQWHHVLARYDGSNDSGAKNGIIIDGGVKENLTLAGAGAIDDDSEIPLFIGGVYDGDDKNEFDIEKFEGGFGGMIDQVEIFDRYLINFEAQKLCNMAAGEGWQSDSKNVAGLCADVEW